ncbi:MAG: sodium-dependent transporter [Verrucomicrobia bacterium]|jgi:neurotransmitter:Na+ symporter, NSS family|nr:sodium-dependent transporter [Verrucomicrobiota bacterium]MBT7068151.1 sodium-dependent transporter [Verrucomicrobiota bacterium]MBT7699069.1 sodium-dependent transporter [Verrucomicrobiota bacterium]
MAAEQKERECWNTRSAFILAAIGSAVGLGNLWGFPYKLYAHGGGAFLIPYFIAMVVMGVPLLIMEFCVGHWSQQSPPSAFAEVAGRYRFAGWWLVALAFVIITYYTVILGYCVIFLVQAVGGLSSGELPWAGASSIAKEHFFDDILNCGEGFSLSGMRWPVFGGMLTSWVLIYLCLFRGVKWVSKVVLITVPLPWIMLLILTVRGLTLEGATTGLQFYLEPHWEKLAEVDTWRFAFGQVFFSMSLGFAVMLSYASFLHRRSDINNNALIIGLGDLGTSFVAGIAVFSTLGAMALSDNVAVDQVVQKGPGLAFVTFPYALSKLPTAPALFSLIFFVALLTLGIDSAFSIVEACLSSVLDNKPGWSRRYVLPGICIVGIAIGTLYCLGGGGLNILGFVDDLINGPLGILAVALAECLIVGWAYGGRFVKSMREHANQRSDWHLYGWWEVIIRYVAPTLLTVLIIWSVADATYNRNWMLLGGSGVFLLIPLVAWFVVSREPDTEHHPTERIPGRDRGLVVKLLFLIPGASILLGVLIGLIRPRPVVVVPAVAVDPAPFVAAELGLTAYIIMGVAFLVIFGGLIWCFARAVKAAGAGDTELPSQT